MNHPKTLFKRITIFAQLFLLALVSVTAISAQSGSIDPTFNAIISRQINGGSFTLQPDGKILTYGRFQVVNGVNKNNIARLNSDGTLDSSFNCAACDFIVNSTVLQSDGKIIISGSLSAADGAAAGARLRRLNADGSLDNTFNPPSPFNSAPAFPQFNSAEVVEVQPDGKVLVVLSTSAGGSNADILYRLNTDGSIDNSFSLITVGGGRLVRTVPVKIVLLSDGKILVAANTFSGAGNSTRLNRYNADGTSDSSFESPTFTARPLGSSNVASINDFEVLPDGSIIVVGNFNAVNAVDRVNIVKLQSAGNVDLSFIPANTFAAGEPATGIEVYSNGKILVSTGNVSAFGASPGETNRFIRYNADGSLDTSFTSPTGLRIIAQFEIDNSDSVLVYEKFVNENNNAIDRFSRFNPNGSIASSFTVNIGSVGSVRTLAVQSDGKIVIGGDFNFVSGIARNNIARLNSDGTLDTSFDPGTGFNNSVEKVVIQSDGKILVGGVFSAFNGIQQNPLVRLNSNGSLDDTFVADVLNGTILAISIQTDGKILIGGSFDAISGQTRNGLARLNSNGSIDNAFNPALGNPVFSRAAVRRILILNDGKLLVGGSFTGINGFNRSNLVRLNTDGNLDPTFNAGNIGSVTVIEIYTNGQFIVTSGTSLVRLNQDGTTDSKFQSPGFNAIINGVFVVPDGSLIVVGDFTAVASQNRFRIVRLRENGTVDSSFFPNGANDVIRTIVRQADGRVLIGGDFSMIANVTRLAAARLIIGAVRQPMTAFDFDGDGKADIAVFRPSNGFWYELRSQNNAFFAMQFGVSTDILAPADYDGDGKTDIAVFREIVPFAGDKSYFYITNSSDGAFRPVQFGTQGDLPISGDWDGDGIDDLAVYRNAAAAGGQSAIYYRPSSQPGVDFVGINWGTAGDKPVRGDFDGDGKLDAAVFRPSNGVWYILQSSNNQPVQTAFGVGTDIPVPADYDGDGKTNIAVFRPSTGTWFTSTDPQTNYGAVRFGANGDLPVPADYDGDGRADIAVFRPTNGVWYLLQSTAGFTAVQFGISEDKPVPNSYIR